MVQLTIKVPGAPVHDCTLAPGSYRIGRDPTLEIVIDHPSISHAHAELVVEDSAARIIDLGSTNGMTVDGRNVSQTELCPGQEIRLGDVALLIQPAPAERGPVKLMMQMPGDAPGVPRTTVHFPPPPPARVEAPPPSFYRCIPGAFLYPLRKNGIFFLVVGTVIFGVVDCLITSRYRGQFIAGTFLAPFFASVVTGYLFEYMQTVVSSSANGEKTLQIGRITKGYGKAHSCRTCVCSESPPPASHPPCSGQCASAPRVAG
jgi:hypothetical protein